MDGVNGDKDGLDGVYSTARNDNSVNWFDGNHAYATGYEDNAVSWYERNHASTGALNWRTIRLLKELGRRRGWSERRV